MKLSILQRNITTTIVINNIHRFTAKLDFYTPSECRNCGGPWPHNNNICPAKGKSCLNSGKSNHFAKVCRSTRKARVGQQENRKKYHKNKVHKIYGKPSSSESSSEDEFIFTLKPTCKDKTTPQVQISVNTTPINMVIDRLVPLAFNTLQKQRPIVLQRSKTRIFAYGATYKPATFYGTISCNSRMFDWCNNHASSCYQRKFWLFTCLLNYQTASALGLIMLNVNNVKSEHATHKQPMKEYVHLFKGIGTLKNFEVYKLRIDDTVPPVAQPPPPSYSFPHAAKGLRCAQHARK